MEMKEFCNAMGSELAGWKARMYDIISHVGTLPEIERVHFDRDVNTIKSLISEIEESIRTLYKECPTDFRAYSEDLYKKVAELKEKMGNIWDFDHIAGGYVGG